MISKKIKIVAIIWMINIIIIAFISSQGTAGNNKELILKMINVGQGDAILITAPNGANTLIDTGPNKEATAEIIRELLPETILDLVILTHPDKDHIGGYPELSNYLTIKNLMAPNVKCTTQVCDMVEASASASDITKESIAQQGQEIILDKQENISITILHPNTPEEYKGSDKNEESVIALLQYKESRALLTGDATTENEQEVIQENNELQAQILKVGHHGSKTSTSDTLLESVKPQVALISVGKDNRYNHPTEEVLEKLNKRSITIKRTDQEGTVSYCTIGDAKWNEC